MSVLLMAQVWQRQIPRPEQSVLLALADHGHDDGSHIWPSYGYIGWKTNYDPRQAKRIIAKLIRVGAVKIIRRGGPNKSSNQYSMDLSVYPMKPPYRAPVNEPTSGDILPPDRDKRPVDKSVDKSTHRGVTVTPRDHRSVVPMSPAGDTDVTSTSGLDVTLILNKPSNNPKTRARDRRDAPNGSVPPARETRDEARERIARAVRDKLRDLAKTPYGRNPHTLAMATGAPLDIVQEVLDANPVDTNPKPQLAHNLAAVVELPGSKR